MSSQGQPSDHIAADRLDVIAKSRETFFTAAEFLHVQICRTCFNVWKEFMEESESEKDLDSN